MGQGKRNDGLIVSGNGSVRADQLAVGRQASIKVVMAGQVLTNRGLQDVKDKLDELIRVISAHPEGPSQQEELIRSADIVADELAKPKPNKLTITSILDGIANSMKSVAGIVSASEALKAAVTALF
jgi:hypothetical protein